MHRRARRGARGVRGVQGGDGPRLCLRCEGRHREERAGTRGADGVHRDAYGVKSSLQTIGDDLTKLKDAQGDLSGDRKDEAAKAWQTFRTEVKTIRENLLTSLSAADAKQQLASSVDDLAASFRTAFAPVDCS